MAKEIPLKSARFGLRLLAAFAVSTGSANATILSNEIRVVNGYTLSFQSYNWNGEDNMLFQVSRPKKPLVEIRAHGLWVYSMDSQIKSFQLEPKTKIRVSDLTGDGIPDVIIQEWNGAVSGGYKYHIYSLGMELHRLWSVDGATLMHVNTTNRDLQFQDETFAYFSDFPPHQIQLTAYFRWRDGRFRLRRSGHTPVDSRKLAHMMEKPDSIEARMYFVELVYAGHADAAVRLLEKMKDQRQFVTSFYGQFKKSPFYYDLVPANSRRAIIHIQQLLKS